MRIDRGNKSYAYANDIDLPENLKIDRFSF